jgi:hypothetical protein
MRDIAPARSGACREAIELYFSTPPERWRAPLTR